MGDVSGVSGADSASGLGGVREPRVASGTSGLGGTRGASGVGSMSDPAGLRGTRGASGIKQIVYCVEDDAALQELYQYSLEEDFDCRCFSDGEAFFVAFEQLKPDLILLDIMLPGDDGFSILSKLKSVPASAHIPVIVVSAKDEEYSKVKGLNMGADDYIAKPFSVLELLARIKANLRKSTKLVLETIAFKDVEIDVSKHQIAVNDQLIQTTLKEYKLLCLLCANPEIVQSREVIFSLVWGEDFIGETRTLDNHVKQLRKKLEAAGSAATIETIRGVGYKLI